MKLLIITQALDRTDPGLGFFHEWIKELAERCESVQVICLKEGEHDLPSNVYVHSLGKESRESRLRYIVRFYLYAWSLRREYDVVFVHMNQEYVLLGALLWRVLSKRVYLWRNHYDGNILTGIAVTLSSQSFCTSRFSYTSRFKKTMLMPVGVSLHARDESLARVPRSILYVGRIAPSKHLEVSLEALGILAKQGVAFSATFAGPTTNDQEYPRSLQMLAEKLGIYEHISFVGPVPDAEKYSLYDTHEIFVDCSKSGMFNKTLFEASQSGCLVLATSRDFAEAAGEEFAFPENNSEILATKLDGFLSVSAEERARMTATLKDVAKKHSLPILADRLMEEMQKV